MANTYVVTSATDGLDPAPVTPPADTSHVQAVDIVAHFLKSDGVQTLWTLTPDPVANEALKLVCEASGTTDASQVLCGWHNVQYLWCDGVNTSSLQSDAIGTHAETFNDGIVVNHSGGVFSYQFIGKSVQLIFTPAAGLAVGAKIYVAARITKLRGGPIPT